MENLNIPPDKRNDWWTVWVERRLVNGLRWLSAFFLATIAGVVALDVFTRYFLKAPLNWAQDVASLALLLVFTAAVPIATVDNQHVMAETMYEKLPMWLQRFFERFGILSGVAFMGVLSYWQFHETVEMYVRGDGADTIDILYWPISGAFTAFAIVTTMVLLVRVFRGQPPAIGESQGEQS